MVHAAGALLHPHAPTHARAHARKGRGGTQVAHSRARTPAPGALLAWSLRACPGSIPFRLLFYPLVQPLAGPHIAPYALCPAPHWSIRSPSPLNVPSGVNVPVELIDTLGLVAS